MTKLDKEALEMLNTKAEPEVCEVTLTADQLLALREPMTEEEMLQPGVAEALVAEIQAAGERAKEFIKHRDEATNQTKRDYYQNKLTRNNEEAADVIVALERIIQVKEAHEANADATGDIVQDGPREESTN